MERPSVGHDALVETRSDSSAGMFTGVSDLVLGVLRPQVDSDWDIVAGSLDWTCRQTADHMVDCIFSYAFQLASRAQEGFLPFGELHALPDATPTDLVAGLVGVTELFSSLLRTVPKDVEASDGVVSLNVDDWATRAAYELLLHTHDITSGLGAQFDPPRPTCARVLASPKLWMLDQAAASTTEDSWHALLIGSGR